MSFLMIQVNVELKEYTFDPIIVWKTPKSFTNRLFYFRYFDNQVSDRELSKVIH